MRHTLLVGLFLASFALTGCCCMKKDAYAAAAPKKNMMTFFSCPADGGPCVAEARAAN